MGIFGDSSRTFFRDLYGIIRTFRDLYGCLGIHRKTTHNDDEGAPQFIRIFRSPLFRGPLIISFCIPI